MDYKKLYASKLCTAREAVKVVTSGDWIDYGWCTGHPVALDQALAARMPELEDVKVTLQPVVIQYITYVVYINLQ